MSFIRAFFGKRPKVGEVWEFDEDENPFKRGHTVTIKAVEKGYVLYDWKGVSPPEGDSKEMGGCSCTAIRSGHDP